MSSRISMFVHLDRTQRADNFVKRLEELEGSVQKLKNDIRFYTPSTPMIGITAVGNAVPAQQQAAAQVAVTTVNSSQVSETETEYSSSDGAGELDDSLEVSS